jgi:hypothetical protein
MWKMNELLIILQAIGMVILVVIVLAIIIPLTFYLHKKRTTSNLYRRIEATLFFGLFVWWTHSWTDWGDLLIIYWTIIILAFCFLQIMLWANPVEKQKRSKPRKKRLK